ncbi:hypothetical protein [Oceaniglobus trochenteri]|uniref:hypothetical protein n=1 Tax=Oceaniglobus trochenteri TaxID=2763260 RepID=UPI001CFFA566|nr:hypothetical protein [Oceaniglobus trochenteri]
MPEHLVGLLADGSVDGKTLFMARQRGNMKTDRLLRMTDGVDVDGSSICRKSWTGGTALFREIVLAMDKAGPRTALELFALVYPKGGERS